MPTCYIAIGSNLDDREQNIKYAVDLLRKIDEILALKVSPLYETDPVDMPPESPKFLNGAMQLQTFLSPRNLMDTLLDIERELGRDRGELRDSHQDRTIDLDLLLYGDQVVDQPGVTVPHPRMHERVFVLKPLSDLCPTKIVPGLNKSVKELLHDLESKESIEPYEGNPSND